MNELKPEDLAGAKIIESPAKREAEAALKLEAMRRVIARLPKNITRKMRGKESAMEMMMRLGSAGA